MLFEFTPYNAGKVVAEFDVRGLHARLADVLPASPARIAHLRRRSRELLQEYKKTRRASLLEEVQKLQNQIAQAQLDGERKVPGKAQVQADLETEAGPVSHDQMEKRGCGLGATGCLTGCLLSIGAFGSLVTAFLLLPFAPVLSFLLFAVCLLLVVVAVVGFITGGVLVKIADLKKRFKRG
jgi:uncharacterized membrane protein (DUF106 family)